MEKTSFHYHIVLFAPEIPPNTGNAGRLAVATGASLHLIEPLGFSIDDKEVRRAGLDYWKHVDLHIHKDFDAWLAWHKDNLGDAPFYFFSKKTKGSFYQTKFPRVAAFVFGRETKGLPDQILDKYSEQTLTIPMFSDKIRSLNLSNAVSVVLYEAIRQQIINLT
ncbi:MAG: tRNA (cytidine(34)-2'-O)-methyltransferase [Bacteriovoracia bacterium]